MNKRESARASERASERDWERKSLLRAQTELPTRICMYTHIREQHIGYRVAYKCHRPYHQHTATHYTTPQHAATYCNTLQQTWRWQRSDIVLIVQVIFFKWATNYWARLRIMICGRWKFAVCCSVLQSVEEFCSVLQYVAVCCSVLQCVAVCHSVWQCVAVCWRALTTRSMPYFCHSVQ